MVIAAWLGMVLLALHGHWFEAFVVFTLMIFEGR
jgi:hypothetical protein